MGRPVKRSYSDEDRSRALFALQINNQEIRKTARELSIPEATLRKWKNQLERGDITQEVVVSLGEQADRFVEKAVKVRDDALDELHKKLPKARPSELNAIIGTLDDKITRAKGIPTQKVEHELVLPTPEAIAELVGNMLTGAVRLAEERTASIVDAEYSIVEPAQIAEHSTK